MSALLAVLLAASFDGQAALGHASSLAALGPHPLGSPRNQAAAAYVAAQMREAGLDAVELAPFESHGVQGTNVIGTLRAPGDELVVIGAHHDTVAEAPGERVAPSTRCSTRAAFTSARSTGLRDRSPASCSRSTSSRPAGWDRKIRST